MRRLVACALLLGAGCRPDFDVSASQVTAPRLLTVRAEPAEVAPGATIALTTLVASPSGTVVDAPLAWALCRVPKPLAENDVVATACLGDGSMPFGAAGPTVTATIPSDACALFGPDTPPQKAGQPPQRPRDPDPTGGYFQPVRVTLGDGAAFELARVRCNLANASVDVAAQFRASYTANQNPSLTPLVATVDGAAVDLAAIPAGSKVTFTIGWPAESVESFPVYDPLAQSLVTHREAMRVSWFASGGAFDDDATGRDENDTALDTSNGWRAPAVSGTTHLWVVLHDSRGGVAFQSYELTVR